MAGVIVVVLTAVGVAGLKLMSGYDAIPMNILYAADGTIISFAGTANKAGGILHAIGAFGTVLFALYCMNIGAMAWGVVGVLSFLVQGVWGLSIYGPD